MEKQPLLHFVLLLGLLVLLQSKLSLLPVLMLLPLLMLLWVTEAAAMVDVNSFAVADEAMGNQ